MTLDFPSHIVDIGLRAYRRNCRKISCYRDFRIRTLNSGALYKFTPIPPLTTKRAMHPHAPAPDPVASIRLPRPGEADSHIHPRFSSMSQSL